MELLKMIENAFRSTSDCEDFASPCNINSLDNIENGGG